MQVTLFSIFLREKGTKKFSWKVNHQVAIERIQLTTAKETTHLSVTRLHHARYILMEREKEKKDNTCKYYSRTTPSISLSPLGMVITLVH